MEKGMKKMRLQKFLAHSGVCSRRKAEEYIRAGRVKIDGVTVREMGVSVEASSHVAFDGKEVRPAQEYEYYLLNKPAGYITTLADPQGRPTVISLLSGITSRVFPVGRLDLDTEGALLLTNDGELTQRILHPSKHTRKTYHALVKGHPDPANLQKLERGIVLEGRPTAPAHLRLVQQKSSSTLIEITLYEGRKRQVKKMFLHIGHPVLFLKRTAYGKLTLGNLPRGAWKRLNPPDLEKIFL